MNISEFLEERIAAEERLAELAAEIVPNTWRAGPGKDFRGVVLKTRENGTFADVGDTHPNLGLHIVGWQPARVLAECAAKRAVIAAYQSLGPETHGMFEELMPQSAESGARQAFEVFLYEVADIYSTHPDYNPEWSMA